VKSMLGSNRNHGATHGRRYALAGSSLGKKVSAHAGARSGGKAEVERLVFGSLALRSALMLAFGSQRSASAEDHRKPTLARKQKGTLLQQGGHV
jgi:hypothetical protein